MQIIGSCTRTTHYTNDSVIIGARQEVIPDRSHSSAPEEWTAEKLLHSRGRSLDARYSIHSVVHM